MDPNYHPETDQTEFLILAEITKYQMLVGSANWAVSLGRFDIHYAVSTLARYSALPRQGHLQAILRVFGYLKNFNKRRLVINSDSTDVPTDLPKHNWSEFYPGAKEELPKNMPEPKGKSVAISTIFDASHASDLVTRRSVTGAIIQVNKTVIKTYCKRQNTVESSTYGSELVAVRIAVDLTIESRYILRTLGVPIYKTSLLYGDNQSVITNTTLPSSVLKKKHCAIAYHRVREAVAALIVNFVHIKGVNNIADLLTKPLTPQLHYHLIQGYLH